MISLSERALGLLGFDAEFIDVVLGDLTEEFVARVARDGVVRARLWYAREILRSTPHVIVAVIRRGGRSGRIVVAALLAAIFLAVSATSVFILLRDGPPLRLVSDLADEADVILLNQTRPVKLPMRVLDARGHKLEPESVRYTWQAGAPITVTPTGVVTCTQPGDAVVHASLGLIVHQLAIRCRPVKAVFTSSSVDLIEGGEAREVPFNAVGMDDQPVTELRGALHVGDTSIAVLSGMVVVPQRAGSTTMDIKVGDRRERTQLIVHERVASFVGLRPDKRHVAALVRLAQGDTLHWPSRAERSGSSTWHSVPAKPPRPSSSMVRRVAARQAADSASTGYRPTYSATTAVPATGRRSRSRMGVAPPLSKGLWR
jgi:hypothetical protein